MWGKVVEEVRRAGPWKIAVIVVVAVIAVIFAYGNHSSDGAASGRTLPRAPIISAPHIRLSAHGR